MDSIVKKNIIKLKNEGYGYKKIASLLDVSIGSVRNALKAEDTKETCKYCGKRLVFIKGHKKKIFCSDACRYTFWNERKKVSR